MNYPDFTPQGYKLIRELGRNREGGRITWLALQLNTGHQVVIKQFCFAQAGSNWSAYKEQEREIQVLKGLKHPGIPEYLGAFETDDGFCLVQEYKNAQNLATERSFAPEEIKQIAVKVLEILVYLQNRIPPVIHRDIKPENILVDDQLNVYLIDFGMSRIGSQEVAASSVFKGTPGFIPPEQLRQPTVASDLYGLGATLICLLTGKKSTQIYDLTDKDDPYVIHFRRLLPRLSNRFLDWLELMVKPKLKERFADAQTALQALKPLDVVRVPEVTLSTSVLEFTATQVGERLKQTIQVVNTMSETLLEGKWEVAPHKQDPPHTPDSHSWIVVSPREFKGNKINCDVQVDTSKLMAEKSYERQLWLRSNANVEVHSVTVRVKTAPLPIERRSVPYLWLAGSLLSFAGLGYAGGVLVLRSGFLSGFLIEIGDWIADEIGLSIWVATNIGAWIVISCGSTSPEENNSMLSFIVAFIIAITAGIWLWGARFVAGLAIATWIWIAIWISGLLGSTSSEENNSTLLDRIKVFIVTYIITIIITVGIRIGLSDALVIAAGLVIVPGLVIALGIRAGLVIATRIRDIIAPVIKFGGKKLGLFTAGLGISSGIAVAVGTLHPYILLALLATGLPFVTMLLYPPIQRRWLIAQYRRSEEHLIRP